MRIIETQIIKKSKSSLYINFVLPIHRTTLQYDSLIYNIINPIVERFIDNNKTIHWSVKISSGEYLRITEIVQINRLEVEYNQIIRIKK